MPHLHTAVHLRLFVCPIFTMSSHWQTQGRSGRRRARQYKLAAKQCVWGGQRLSFLFLNAMYLTGSKHGAVKAVGMTKLLSDSKWPGLVGITEVGRPAGVLDLRTFFGEAISRRYTMVWSQRSISITDGAPDSSYKNGGGIALLIHKRLWLRPSEMKMDVTDEERLKLDGHLRVWRLDPIPCDPGKPVRPRPHAMRRPVVVTVAYIPPIGVGWGDKVRDIVFDTIESTDIAIQQLRRVQDVFPLTMAHTNAPDGGCAVEMAMESDNRPYVELRDELDQLCPSKTLRAMLELTVDGRRMLHRCRSLAQARDVTTVGKKFIATAARAGKIPLSGVMGHRQSDSWTRQSECAACQDSRVTDCERRLALVQRNASVSKRHHALVRSCGDMSTSVHDIILVPDYLVWQALVSPTGGKNLLWQCTRRIDWADPAPIDHAVTVGHCFVSPMAVGEVLSVDHAESVPAIVEERMPRRYHPSDDLLLKHKELRAVCADMDNNIWSALANVGDHCDIDLFNTAFTSAALAACEVARVKSAQDELESDTMTVRRARRERHEHWIELNQAVQDRPVRKSDRTFEQKQRVKIANRVYRAADLMLQTCVDQQNAASQLWRQKRAPKKHWRVAQLLATDAGAPDNNGSSAYLLDHQNDDNQQFETSDPVQLKENMRQNRKGMYEMKSEARLGPDCAVEINRALAALHFTNQRIVVDNPDMANHHSAVTQSVANAAAPIADADLRRGIVRDLDEFIEQHASDVTSSISQCQSTKDKYPAAVLRLHRELTMEELLLMCAKIRDVGAGTDGVAPIVLKLQQAGHTMDAILLMFQTCMKTGCQPAAWRMHRNLFLYKGKNTDPYHLGNHRGLGIDQVLLKLWSLLMMERLEEFLLVTNGLSGLQGGFQRQRGPIEQAFTLAETVRAATQRRTVYLLFLDIEQAYDSVIRPILWKRCIDKGIDGPFLAALQATYFCAEARVDAGGILLDPVPLEIGVLQGNPLSPALFNIYIDGAIQELMARGARNAVPFGIPLPRIGDPNGPQVLGLSVLSQEDHLPCLYFADDGVLLAFDLGVLQDMLDITVSSLAALGLTVNVRKTKWMVVPTQHTSVKEYEERIKPRALQSVLRVGTQPIMLVDEFVYLGVTMWWRWDWSKACRDAQMRARKAYFGALRGGWQHRTGSLNSQMSFAHAKVFCHFNYIAALTGTGGAKSSAPWRVNEDIVGWVLHAVSGQLFANQDALRIEAGIWPWQDRCDMLLLRMWCKFLSMPTSSVFYRAMCLSMQSMWPEQRNHPNGTPYTNRITELHRQPWAQHLFAAAERVGIAKLDVQQLRHGLFEVHVDALNDGQWIVSTGLEGADVGVRLVAARGNPPYVEGTNCWRMPEGTIAADVLRSWSEQHKVACYYELRRLGNQGRQARVRTFLLQQVRDNTRLRLWATTLSCSFEQPYWRLPDAPLARRLLALRFDVLPTADAQRWRVRREACMLPDRNERACYLCSSIDGVPNIYWPDTLVHVLLRCTCPELVHLRDECRKDLQALATDAATVRVASAAGVPCPLFVDDTELLTAMQLCVGTGPGLILTASPIAPLYGAQTRAAVSRHALVRRNAPQFVRHIPTAQATAAWVCALSADWCDIYRDVRRREYPLDSPGCRLTRLMAKHAVIVFSVRRRLLKESAEFATNARDPEKPAPRPIAVAVSSTQLTFDFAKNYVVPTTIADESLVAALNLSSPNL